MCNLVAFKLDLIRMTVSEHSANTLFQQIAADGTGTHRLHFFLKCHAFCSGFIMIMGSNSKRALKRHEADKTAVSLERVVRKIETKAESDQDNKIFANEGTMLEQFVHSPIESYSLLVDKSENIIISAA